MTQYAANTEVSVERSKAEIERTLQRYGADSFMSGWDQEKAVLAFRLQKRQIRFVIPLPKRDEFLTTPTGKRRTSQDSIASAWEQACRQKWRALALVVKAKLEAVESGITTIEDEFMAHIVLPSGTTVGAWMRPQIEKAYSDGKMPSLLPETVEDNL